jgi:hypothetical protein
MLSSKAVNREVAAFLFAKIYGACRVPPSRHGYQQVTGVPAPGKAEVGADL